MSDMRVKLLTVWLGPKPSWYRAFVERMATFRTVDWECLPDVEGRRGDDRLAGAHWLNTTMSRRLEVTCVKDERHYNASCDYRPAFGEVFADRYAGYDWWGWCDLDVYFGDVDRLLPPLLEGDHAGLTFKPNYPSGCLTLLRNTPEVVGLFRRGPWQECFADSRYWVWDESGYPAHGDRRFWDLLAEHGLGDVRRPDLYSYDSRSEPRTVWWEDGRLLSPPVDGWGEREVLLHHFMTDRYPFPKDLR